MRFGALLLSLALWGCATPGTRYFAGEAQTCAEVMEVPAWAEAHQAELSDAQRADLLLDTAHCRAEELVTRSPAPPPAPALDAGAPASDAGEVAAPDAGAPEADAGAPEADAGAPAPLAGAEELEAMLAQAQKLDPHKAAEADAERAALLAAAGRYDEAETMFQRALGAGFDDLDLVLAGREFAALRKAPQLEQELVQLAASSEPVRPRVLALAEKLGQRPVSLAVVEANPKYGLHTFTVWQGRVLESHYDEENDETMILLEELVPHLHAGEGEEHQHYETMWTPEAGFTKVPHEHVHEREEEHAEMEATGRFFGLRVKGFPREMVEAPDLEVVGYYLGRSPFWLRGEEGEAATLDVVRAVPFNSGVHLGAPVAHE